MRPAWAQNRRCKSSGGPDEGNLSREEGATAEQTVEPYGACNLEIQLYQDCKRCCNNDIFVFSDEEYCNCDGIRPSEE